MAQNDNPIFHNRKEAARYVQEAPYLGGAWLASQRKVAHQMRYYGSTPEERISGEWLSAEVASAIAERSEIDPGERELRHMARQGWIILGVVLLALLLLLPYITNHAGSIVPSFD